MISPESDRLIDFLNGLLAIDSVWVQEMMSVRWVCNAQLASHQTVQVAMGSDTAVLVRPGEYRAGVLGLLNGFCGVFDDGPKKGWGPITAHYDGGHLVRFERTPNE